MSERFSLKDQLFNQNKIEKIASAIKATYPQFKQENFIRETVNKFPNLELKERISWIATQLKKHLPSKYQEAVIILLNSLPEPNNPKLSDNDFGDFIYAPYSEFVAKNGCSLEYLDFSLNALKEITKRFSAEDAIRYFINKFPEATIKSLQDWCRDDNYHVRRLCSEGTRAKLPWSQKLNINYKTPLNILNQLYFDKTRYVTRSVANHLNDISKTDPEFVITILKNWTAAKKQNNKEMSYITRHSLRTLIKQGNQDAIELLGFSNSPAIKVSDFNYCQEVAMNSYLEFSFKINAKQNENLIIDYAIYFQNKAGKSNNRKVFKLKQIKIKQSEIISIKKKHLLRQFMTTRTLYPGKQKLELLINGKKIEQKEFFLT